MMAAVAGGGEWKMAYYFGRCKTAAAAAAVHTSRAWPLVLPASAVVAGISRPVSLDTIHVHRSLWRSDGSFMVISSADFRLLCHVPAPVEDGEGAVTCCARAGDHWVVARWRWWR